MTDDSVNCWSPKQTAEMPGCDMNWYVDKL